MRPITICCAIVRGLGSECVCVTSLEDKDQWRLLFCLHNRETCTPTCAEHDFWHIHRSQLVQVDCLVPYPLAFIHLSLGLGYSGYKNNNWNGLCLQWVAKAHNILKILAWLVTRYINDNCHQLKSTSFNYFIKSNLPWYSFLTQT